MGSASAVATVADDAVQGGRRHLFAVIAWAQVPAYRGRTGGHRLPKRRRRGFFDPRSLGARHLRHAAPSQVAVVGGQGSQRASLLW